MNRFDSEDFRKTCFPSMESVESDDDPPFDFWPYFEQIPQEDFEGFDCTDGQVDWVWRTSDGAFEHVLINTKEDSDVFMALVLDRKKCEVFGHRILNLRAEYGLGE